jgi:TRAP-type C4-dicarboxylate transport system permease small subunit
MTDPRAMVQTMITLASASLGLVAALAWNEAIKATLATLGLSDDLAGLYTYAILATVLAIVVLAMLGKLSAKIGGQAAFEREAEG